MTGVNVPDGSKLRVIAAQEGRSATHSAACSQDPVVQVQRELRNCIGCVDVSTCKKLFASRAEQLPHRRGDDESVSAPAANIEQQEHQPALRSEYFQKVATAWIVTLCESDVGAGNR